MCFQQFTIICDRAECQSRRRTARRSILAVSTREPRKSRVVFSVCSRARYTRNPSLDIYLLSVHMYRACRFKFYKLWCSPESKPVGVRSSNFNQLQLCILCMVYPSHLVIPDMVAEILHVQWKDLWIWRAGFFRVFLN